MQIKTAVFTMLLVLLRIYAHSQTLYELKYHFQLNNGREDYKALMLRNADGTGTIRLTYVDLKTHSRNLVEIEMEESYGENEDGSEDSTMLIYVGLDQKQILGKVLYPPDHYVFKLNPRTKYYEPDFVLSINDDGTEDLGVIDEALLLQKNDLSKERILQYYTTSDEVYKNLFVESLRRVSPELRKTTLYLLLVANTNDKSIGKTCEVDKDATLKTFSEIAEFLQIEFKPIVIAGNNFNKTNVETNIKTLQPGNRDIVVFYYSGHGFNQPGVGYDYPFMDLRDKSFQTVGGEYTLNIENVYKDIKAKGARLNLVYSDCCNSIPEKTNLTSSLAATTRSSSIGWDMQNCKLLFMKEQPMSLLMTAAQKGELSAGNTENGGIFTFNFREAIEKNIRLFANDVSWDNLLISAQKQTISKAKQSNCAEEGETQKRCIQNPIFKMEK